MFVRFEARTRNCEIGVWAEPAGTGHGLITAAARLLVEYAVTVRGMHRVEWITTPGNTRSRAVAQRLGMTLDGVLRQEYPHHSVRHDAEVWSILADEWTGSGS